MLKKIGILNLQKVKVYQTGRAVFSIFLFLIPIVYFSISLLLVRLISSNDQAAMLRWYNKYWPDGIDKETMAKICFTPQWEAWVSAHHKTLIIGILLGLLIYALFSKKIWKYLHNLFDEINKIMLFMIRVFKLCTTKEKAIVLVLFGCIAAYRIYFFISYPPLTDETFSYLYFAKQGVLLTAISYPFPNNHVLYNLACSVLTHVPFLTPMMVMRLPNMIGDLLLFWAVFCLFKYFGSFQRSVVIVSGTAFCYIISFYATQGRGYQWQEICTTLSLLGCWAWFFSPAWSHRFGYSLFLFSSMVGFYINPAFIYQFLALILMVLMILLRRKDYAQIGILLRSAFIIFLFTTILYLPLIIGSSLHTLTNNQSVGTWKSWSFLVDTFSDLKYSMNYVFDLSRAGIFIGAGLIAFSLGLYFTQRIKGTWYDFGFLYFLATLLSFTILILYKKVYPYQRFYCSWALFINIIFLNVCYDFFKSGIRKNGSLLISIFVLLKIAVAVRLLYWDRYFIRNEKCTVIYNNIQTTIQRLISYSPQSWQIPGSGDFPLYIRLYLISHSRKDRIISDRKTLRGDVVFLPDTYPENFSPKGYVIFSRDKNTVSGQFNTILVNESIIKSH
jgi:hypothetical protein